MTATETYTFIFRSEGKNFDPMVQDSVNVDLPAGLDLQTALETARSNGLIGKGSHRSGCFEVWCDRGIWTSTVSKRIDLSTDRKAAKVVFASWDDMDATDMDAADCGTPVESTGRTWF